ncbi:MAG TPA: alpha-2-macroglobulin, partial [Candidatus Binatia bacterium]
FADHFERDVVDGTTSVTLGPASARLAWDAHPAGDVLTLPWSADAPLALAHQGGGAPWVTVQARAALPPTEPHAHGLRVTRTVGRVGDAASGAPQAAGNALHVGDLVAVRLEIEAEADTPWVVVSDPLPGGGSHVGGGAAPAESTPRAADAAAGSAGDLDEAATTPLFVERAQEAFRAYFDLLPKGRTVVEHTLRVNQQGRFLVPPTRVEAMYAPEVYGEVPNAPVAVEP